MSGLRTWLATLAWWHEVMGTRLTDKVIVLRELGPPGEFVIRPLLTGAESPAEITAILRAHGFPVNDPPRADP